MPSLEKSKAQKQPVRSIDAMTHKRRCSGSKPLLWINKTGHAALFSSSKGPEGSLARAHTQTVVAGRRRQRRTKPIPSQFSKLASGFSQGTSVELSPENHHVVPDQPKTELAIDEDTSAAEHKTSEIPDWVLATSEPDPFDATPLSVDKFARQLLTFHMDWWKSVAPAWRDWHQHDLSKPADVLVAQKCFQDPLYMLTTIMFTAVQMKMLNIPCIGPNLPDVLHLKTIWLLRRALTDQTRDPKKLLEILSFLTLAEVFRKSFAAARVHLGAVKQQLEVIGGISEVVNHVSEMIVFSDFYLALSTLSRPVLGRRVLSLDKPPVFDPAGLEFAPEHRDWIQRLPHETLVWAARQLYFGTQILEQSWNNRRLVMNGYWVRKKCVSIIIQLLDAWQIVDMPSIAAEFARISILLWSACLLSCTLDTQGVKNYIPRFDEDIINAYGQRGTINISMALKKWNQILEHDFGQIPLGCDVILRLLMRVPSELEASGGVFLGTIMDQLACVEERRRLEKAHGLSPSDVARHHRWRVWRTSILLC